MPLSYLVLQSSLTSSDDLFLNTFILAVCIEMHLAYLVFGRGFPARFLQCPGPVIRLWQADLIVENPKFVARL